MDDNQTNLVVLGKLLAAWNIESDRAHHGLEALDLLSAAARGGAQYDFAILDLGMPEMDGLKLATRIQEMGLRSLPLILLTSYVERCYREEAARIGFAAYLTKPVRRTQLCEALIQALGMPGTSASVRGEQPARIAPSRGCVLVVEDNKVNRLLASRLLEKLGYTCDLAENGLEALEQMSRRNYDAVCMDCQMPVMDGFEATAEIRRREAELGHVHVIAMTANAMTGDRERCIAAGMDDYVPKPVILEDLRAALARIPVRA